MIRRTDEHKKHRPLLLAPAARH